MRGREYHDSKIIQRLDKGGQRGNRLNQRKKSNFTTFDVTHGQYNLLQYGQQRGKLSCRKTR